jgi:DNA-binding CsgD family transcriptional regulator
LSAPPERPRAPLLERDHELQRIEDALRPLETGAPRLVVVEGPAGIGKSRLIAEVRQRAVARGLRVLGARGSDLERDFPFGVVRQLFDPLLADPGMAAELLQGAAAAARSVFESIPEAPAEGEDVSFAALHGLYWLTVNAVADRGLVLVVDDLHWCDRPSLRLLAYLSRRLEGLDGALVVGLRTAEAGTDPLLLAEVVSHPEALHVTPAPLSGGGVRELVAGRLGDPDPAFADACLAATGGNPLLLRQLLTSLEADGVVPRAAQADAVRRVAPRAVSRTVLLRLRRLAPAAAAVARAVAILGTHAEPPLVAALADVDELGVVRAAGQLAQAEILRPEQPLEFVHPLVRDAVYHELPAIERELWHARAAELLVAAQRPADAVATQLLAAPRRGRPWVVEQLVEAAGAARRKGAADSAVAYLERALAEPPGEDARTAVTLELGLTETLTSGMAAAQHLREALAGLDAPLERARIAATLARTLLFTAPGAQAVEVVARALAETPEELVDERQALRALGMMAVFFGAGDQAELTRVDDIVIEGSGPGAKMLAAMTAFVRAITGGRVEECLPLALDALADDVLIEADPGLFPVAAITVLSFADHEGALPAWERLRELAYRRGSLLGILTVGLWGGATLLWRGDLREAEESLAGAHADFLSWGLVRSVETYLPAFLALTRLGRGDVAGARALLGPAYLSGERTDGDRHLLRARGALLLAEGRYEEALAVADDLASRLAFIELPAWSGWRTLRARALHGLGRTEEALALAEDELERARRFGAAGMIGRALTLVGELEQAEGVPRLREAVALLEPSPARFDLAAALLALGAALRRARQPTEAREPLARALELADRCGADGLAEQARAELRAAGVRPRTTALQGVDALTASERRVADLAAGGRSNREIAQSLYVTPKTVEVHLSSTYRKLNIRSRQELGRALAA